MKQIVAYISKFNQGKVSLADSLGETRESTSLKDLLDFLLEPFYDEDVPDKVVIKVTWDLDEFVAPIFRLLGRDKCQELAENQKVYYEKYLIFYIRKKIFSVSVSKGIFAQFSGLAEFFKDSDIDTTPTIEGDIQYIKTLGDKLYESCVKMGFYPRRLTSAASILEECVLSHMFVPNTSESKGVSLEAKAKHAEAIFYAENCCRRIWQTAYQVGHWQENESFDYDLRSAYSSEAIKLLNTNMENCEYTKSDKLIETADWGYLKGYITVTQDYSPIMRTNEFRKGENFIGTIFDYITLDEYKFINEFKLGKFELLDGWFLRFKGKQRPFEAVLNRLYSYRGSDTLVNILAKGMMNSFCGKTLEIHIDGTYGKYFNPFYSAQITTNNRLNVARFIIENELQPHLICVQTDGVRSEKQVSDSKLGKGVGTWKLSSTAPLIIVSIGDVYQSDKKPHGINYELLTSMINEHPNSRYYSVDLKKRVTMKDALDGDFNEIGKIKTSSSSVDLIGAKLNQDRIFKKYPETGRQLLSHKYTSEARQI